MLCCSAMLATNYMEKKHMQKHVQNQVQKHMQKFQLHQTLTILLATNSTDQSARRNP